MRANRRRACHRNCAVGDRRHFARRHAFAAPSRSRRAVDLRKEGGSSLHGDRPRTALGILTFLRAITVPTRTTGVPAGFICHSCSRRVSNNRAAMAEASSASFSRVVRWGRACSSTGRMVAINSSIPARMPAPALLVDAQVSLGWRKFRWPPRALHSTGERRAIGCRPAARGCAHFPDSMAGCVSAKAVDNASAAKKWGPDCPRPDRAAAV
jgi:hypothetical protein